MRNLTPIIILLLPALAMAQQGIIYPRARSGITVPAGQYVNIFTPSIATVEKNIGGPANNLPITQWVVETNGNMNQSQPEVVFGPYANGVTLRVTAFADAVYYSVSKLAVATPAIRPGPIMAQDQQTPIAYTAGGTALSTDLLNGMVTFNTTPSSSTATYTLPTGTLLDAALALGIGQAFRWSIINLNSTAGGSVTLAAGSGHTIVGDVLTPVAGSANGVATSKWLTRKTAANTFITYRQ